MARHECPAMARSRRPVTDAYGLVRAEDAARSGSSRRALQYGATSGALRRLHRGVYATTDAPPEQLAIRAAMTHLGPESVAVIGSAAIVHGLAGLPQTWTPQLAVPPGLERRQRDGMEIHVWDLDESDVDCIDGIRVTTMVRTLADVCRTLPDAQSVALVDSALHLRLVRPEQLLQVRATMTRRRNCVAGRRRLDLAREGAQSPGETRIRLLATQAGLPPDELQVPVRDRQGRLLGYADLGYRLAGGWLLVEFDGRSVHELPQAVLDDRHRQNAILAQAGNVMIRFAWEDTYSVDAVDRALRPILVSSGWRPHQSRP